MHEFINCESCWASYEPAKVKRGDRCAVRVIKGSKVEQCGAVILDSTIRTPYRGITKHIEELILDTGPEAFIKRWVIKSYGLAGSCGDRLPHSIAKPV